MSGIEGSAIPIIESDHKDKLTEKKKEQLKNIRGKLNQWKFIKPS